MSGPGNDGPGNVCSGNDSPENFGPGSDGPGKDVLPIDRAYTILSHRVLEIVWCKLTFFRQILLIHNQIFH